jgi:hypothetical protein
LALASIKAGRPLAAAQRLEGVDATKLIAVFTGALQEGAATLLLAHQKAALSWPPAIRISIPEVLAGQAQLTGNPLSFCQVQANLVSAAALTTAKARNGMLGLNSR